MAQGRATPRSALQARYVAVLLTCRSCLRNRNADLAALVADGRGDMPLIRAALAVLELPQPAR